MNEDVGTICDHRHTVKPARPVPDWTGRCPDCGEGVKHDGRGGFTTVRENNERRLAGDEYHLFIAALTRKLNEAGVPAMPSWAAAIDYLVRERDEARAEVRRLYEQYEAESLLSGDAGPSARPDRESGQ